MSRPEIVSFDCAGTLLQTDYSPEGFAMRAARLAGYEPPADLEARYRRLFGARWHEYVALNVQGDSEPLAEFWRSLTVEWLDGSPIEGGEARILAAAEDLLYHPDHRYFSIFEDTRPCLEALRADGYRMIVLSNWDVTLPRVLENAGLSEYFERVFASLVFGIEKPDSRFFRHAEAELGVRGSDFVHVGDRVDDDLDGARGAGWRAYLVDRDLDAPSGDRLHRLTDLVDLLRRA